MATTDEAKERNENLLEGLVGISVVLLATFLGICNVKDGNIVQKMQMKQVEVNNKWAYYQARKLHVTIYQTAAGGLSVPYPSEFSEIKKAREAKASELHDLIHSKKEGQEGQLVKMAVLKAEAEALEKEVAELGGMDDQFDLAEAALSIGLAMMGVTALLKRRWMFFLALVPSAFGTFMGIAGFAGLDTKDLGIKWMIDLLT